MVNEKELNDKIIREIKGVWDYYVKEEKKDDKESLKKDNNGNYIYPPPAAQIKKIFENEKRKKNKGSPDKAFFYEFRRYPMYEELLSRMIDTVMLIYGIDGRKTGKFLRENTSSREKK